MKILWLGPCTVYNNNGIESQSFRYYIHEIGNSKQLHSRFADSCVVAEMQTRRRKNSELLHLRLGKPTSTGAARRVRTRVCGGWAPQATPPSTVRCCAAQLFCLQPPPLPRAGTVGRCFSRLMARRRPFANLREPRRRRRHVTGCCRRIRCHYILRLRD